MVSLVSFCHDPLVSIPNLLMKRHKSSCFGHEHDALKARTPLP